MKKKRLVSRNILQTELRVTLQYAKAMDFGTAITLLEKVLERVKEYDLVPPKLSEAANCPPANAATAKAQICPMCGGSGMYQATGSNFKPAKCCTCHGTGKL